MEVRLKFSEQEIEELVQLLEQREGVEIECIPQLGGGIWLHDPTWEMELRLLLLLNYKVTVSRVCFIHKRQGTMTAVLDFLIRFCREHGVPQICVQSVVTKEMANFCLKNGFVPYFTTSFETEEGLILGDYVMSIE